MAIPPKEQMTGSNTTEAQFKSGMNGIVDYLGEVDKQSLTFGTTAELKLAKAKVGQKAKTLDTGKVWEWDGSDWEDTDEGELDRANENLVPVDNKANRALANAPKKTIQKDWQFAYIDQENKVLNGLNNQGQTYLSDLEIGRIKGDKIPLYTPFVKNWSSVIVNEKGQIISGVDMLGQAWETVEGVFKKILSGSDSQKIKGFEKLKQYLADPLHDVNIVIFGSSTESGVDTTVATNGTWVNQAKAIIAHAYLPIPPNTAATEATLDPANRISWHSAKFYVDAYAADNIKIFDSNRNELAKSSIDISSEKTAQALVVQRNQFVEFLVTTETFDIFYRSSTSDENAIFEVYVDDALVASQNFYEPTEQSDKKLTVSFNYKKDAVVRVVNKSPVDLILEGIERVKRIRWVNRGKSGKTMWYWLPGVGNLTAALDGQDNFSIIAAGSNDTSATDREPRNPTRTRVVMEEVALYMRNTAKTEVIFKTPHAIGNDFPNNKARFYSQADVSRVTLDVASKLEIDVFNAFPHFSRLRSRGASYMYDGVHMTDDGNKVMAEILCSNLFQTIITDTEVN